MPVVSVIPHWVRAASHAFSQALSTIMGHATIAMTFDTYGHLMPGGLDEAARVTNAYLARRDTERPPLKVADG